MRQSEKSIVRTDRAGVFFGEITDRQDTPAGVIVTIRNCRRIWYWDGAASLSELAVEGTRLPHRCKFPTPVESMTVMGVIEIIPCTEKAAESIESVSVWKA